VAEVVWCSGASTGGFYRPGDERERGHEFGQWRENPGHGGSGGGCGRMGRTGGYPGAYARALERHDGLGNG
jgi:hypothetical protein